LTSADTPPVPLYGEAHDADPALSYKRLAEQTERGQVGLAEIAPGLPAYVVIDYTTALELLHDPETWTKDTRGWIDQVPLDAEHRAHYEWRPSIFFADGVQHGELRKVITDTFRLLDPHEVRSMTFRYADELLRRFAAAGKADLVAQFAVPLPLMVFNALFGMPDEYAPRLLEAITETATDDPARKMAGFQAVEAYLGELYAAKAKDRGSDLTSGFIDHPAGLGPEEVLQQVMIVLGAGNEPLTNLISNTLCRLLSDDDYWELVSTGGVSVRHAIEESLWSDAPIATFSLHFPRRDVELGGVAIPAGSPVMVSYAAANACPHANMPADGLRSGNRAHLSFAAGPHRCPASDIAILVATAAVERLLSYLHDVELAVDKRDLRYRGGPIYRSLTALPTRFTPLTPDAQGLTPWSRSAAATA